MFLLGLDIAVDPFQDFKGLFVFTKGINEERVGFTSLSKIYGCFAVTLPIILV